MKNWPYKILFIVFFTLMTLGNADAAPWYVDNEASGNNNGTSWTDAWVGFSTIDWNAISPGDTLYISGGTTSRTYTEALNVGKAGTEGSPITVRPGQDAGHNGVVVIDGQGSLDSLVNMNTKSYVTINGEYNGQRHLQVKNTTDTGTLISANSSYYQIKILYTEMSTGGRGIWGTSPTDGMEVAHNYIHDIRYEAAVEFGGGLASSYGLHSLHDNVIETNRGSSPTGCGPDGLKLNSGWDIYGNKLYSVLGTITGCQHADGMQIMGVYNRIYNNYVDSYTQQIYGNPYGENPAGYLKIYNNVLTNSQSWGRGLYHRGVEVKVESVGDAEMLTDLYIFNNTIVDMTDLRCIAVGNIFTTNRRIRNAWVVNNLLYNCKSAIDFHTGEDGDFTCGTDVVIDYNLAYGGPSGADTINCKYDTPYTQPHPKTGEPKFVQYTEFGESNDYHLADTDGAARDQGAGTSEHSWLAEWAFDVDGVTRPQGAGWDIGAYEFSSTGSPDVIAPAPPSNVTVE